MPKQGTTYGKQRGQMIGNKPKVIRNPGNNLVNMMRKGKR